MAEPLEIAIAAGGTAGHINPALALAEELRDRGAHVTFFGQATRLEATLVPEAGFDFVPIEVTGFDRSRPWTLLTALTHMARAERTLDARFSTVAVPSVAVGFGAYVELPLLRWCHKHGVPCIIHEQNSVPGLANKTLAKDVSCVCVSLPVASKVFEPLVGVGTSIVVTGNPVRRCVRDASARTGRDKLGVGPDSRVLLVFGGSLGARHVNQGVCALKDELLGREDLVVVHSTGKGEYDSVVEQLALTPDEQRRWHVLPYISDMGDMLAAADLVVSRAGASSIAEIAALAVPSLLVPYPFATADHQTTNAHYLVDAGAAEVMADEAIDTPEFGERVLSLLDDPKRRARMREAARGLAQDRAASALADQTEKLAVPRA